MKDMSSLAVGQNTNANGIKTLTDAAPLPAICDKCVKNILREISRVSELPTRFARGKSQNNPARFAATGNLRHTMTIIGNRSKYAGFVSCTINSATERR